MIQNMMIQLEHNLVYLYFDSSDDAIGMQSKIFKDQNVSSYLDMISSACHRYFLGLTFQDVPRSSFLIPFNALGIVDMAPVILSQSLICPQISMLMPH